MKNGNIRKGFTLKSALYVNSIEMLAVYGGLYDDISGNIDKIRQFFACHIE